MLFGENKLRGYEMNDFVPRSKVIEIIFQHIQTDYRSALIEDIQKIPNVDVAPIRRGKWKAMRNKHLSSVRCSACGKVSIYATNYCFYCGAKNDKTVLELADDEEDDLDDE